MIRVSEAHLDAQPETLVVDVLRSTPMTRGPMVTRFEAAFTAMSGTAHAVAVSSGTAALVVALEALRIGSGDEVLTTPFTFVGTLNAILERGARVRLVDIRSDDYTIDVEALDHAVGPTTRAVLPVHLYGHPADMPAIVKVVGGRDVDIIEDAAQAHGATIDGRPVGSFGVGCFSSYATKSLTTGESGMITTDDPQLAERLRTVRDRQDSMTGVHHVPPHDLRMTDLQGAIGLSELQKWPARTDRRRANAARLTEGLAGLAGVATPVEAPGRSHVYHQYTVRIGREARLQRDALARELASRGIETGVYYPRPVYDYESYRALRRVVCEPVPRAERAASEVLSLPVHAWLTEGELDHIVTTMHDLLG